MGIFKHCTTLAAMYLLHVHMHDLIGAPLLMMFIACRPYLMYIEWSSLLLQMKLTGLSTMDLKYVQIQSLDEPLRDVQFQQESAMKWMLLIPGPLKRCGLCRQEVHTR